MHAQGAPPPRQSPSETHAQGRRESHALRNSPTSAKGGTPAMQHTFLLPETPPHSTATRTSLRPSVSMSSLLATSATDRPKGSSKFSRSRPPSRSPSPIMIPPTPSQHEQTTMRVDQPPPFSPTRLSPTSDFAPWSSFVSLGPAASSSERHAKTPSSWGGMANDLLPSVQDTPAHADNSTDELHSHGDPASLSASLSNARQRPRIVTPSSSSDTSLCLARNPTNWVHSPGSGQALHSAASSSSHAQTLSSAAPSSRTTSSYGFGRHRFGFGEDEETLAGSSRRTSAVEETTSAGDGDSKWEKAMESLYHDEDAAMTNKQPSRAEEGDALPVSNIHRKLSSSTAKDMRTQRRAKAIDEHTLASWSIRRNGVSTPHGLGLVNNSEDYLQKGLPLPSLVLDDDSSDGQRHQHPCDPTRLGTHGCASNKTDKAHGDEYHQVERHASSSSSPSLPLASSSSSSLAWSQEHEQAGSHGGRADQKEESVSPTSQHLSSISASNPFLTSPPDSNILILDPRPRHLFLQARIPNSINVALSTTQDNSQSTTQDNSQSSGRYCLVLTFGSDMSKRRFQHVMASTSSSSSPSSASTSRLPSPTSSRKRPIFERSESGSLVPPPAQRQSSDSRGSARSIWGKIAAAVVVPDAAHGHVPFSTLHDTRECLSSDSLGSPSTDNSDLCHYFDLELDTVQSSSPATSPDVDISMTKSVGEGREPASSRYASDSRWSPHDRKPWALVDALDQSRTEKRLEDASAVYYVSLGSTDNRQDKSDMRPPQTHPHHLATGPERWNERDSADDDGIVHDGPSSSTTQHGSPVRLDGLTLQSPTSAVARASTFGLPVSSEPMSDLLLAPAPSGQMPRSASPSLLVDSPGPSSRISSPARPTRPNLARLDTSERVKTLSMSSACSGAAVANALAFAPAVGSFHFGPPTLATKPQSHRSAASSPSVSPRALRSPLRSATVSNASAKDWVLPDIAHTSRSQGGSRRPSLGLSLPPRREGVMDPLEQVPLTPAVEKGSAPSGAVASRFWNTPGASRGAWGWGGREDVHRPASLAEMSSRPDGDHGVTRMADSAEDLTTSRSSSISSTGSVYLTLPSSSTDSHGKSNSFSLASPPGARGSHASWSSSRVGNDYRGQAAHASSYMAGPSPFSESIVADLTPLYDSAPKTSMPAQLQSLATADSAISCILPNFLYLGPDITEASHLDSLRRLGVKRILNMAIEIDPEAELGEKGWKSDSVGIKVNIDEARTILAPAEKQLYESLHPAVHHAVYHEIVHGFEKYLRIPLRDSVEETGVQSGLRKACRFIDDARLHSAPVYVHCKAGKSRSVTAVMGYLIHALRWPLSRAYAFVAERRDVVSPNIGFVAELMKFEQAVLAGSASSDAGDVRADNSGAMDGEESERGARADSETPSFDSERDQLPSGMLSILASRSASTSGISRAAQLTGPHSPRSGALSPPSLGSGSIEWSGAGQSKSAALSPTQPGSASTLPSHHPPPTAMLSPTKPASPSPSPTDNLVEIETRGPDGRYRARRPPADEISLAPGRRATLAGIDSTNPFGKK